MKPRKKNSSKTLAAQKPSDAVDAQNEWISFDGIDTLNRARDGGYIVYDGLTLFPYNGKPTTMAVIDDAGNVIESGPAVLYACCCVVAQIKCNIWNGPGWIPALAEPVTNGRPDELKYVKIKATSHDGLTCKGPDDKPARLAIIDEVGNIIKAGDAVAFECFCAVVAVQDAIWIEQGRLVVAHDGPGIRVEKMEEKAQPAFLPKGGA